MTALAITELTTSTVDGQGTFDLLMKANKAHLEQEFKLGRLKGPEYSTVYLGSLQSVLQTALSFTLEKNKNPVEVLMLQKQMELITAQALNEVKQGNLLDKQIEKMTAEVLLMEAQAANAVKEGNILDKQLLKITAEVALSEAQVTKLIQDTANAVVEGTVLVAQECKLRAEFDLITAQITKSNQELTLLSQKVATERAQITALGVDVDSIVGRQKALYAAQANGFTRDAEQKAADLMVKSWNVRRTTDEGTVADGTNMLNDAAVGRAVTKLLTGVGA